MHYLVLEIEASKTNMLQSLSFLAAAPILPSVMLAHALDQSLKWNLAVDGVGIVHRDCQPWIEYLEQDKILQPFLVQRRGARLFDRKPDPAKVPTQPMALADIKISLILRCGKRADSTDRVAQRLHSMRLAGGQITRAQVSEHDRLDKALGAIGGGYWIEDATDAMAGENPIEGLLSAVEGGEWLVPVNLGYALITEPVVRSGARDGRLHAWVEDMVGLARYVPIRRKESIESHELWRHGWIDGQFVVTNRPEWKQEFDKKGDQ